MFPLGGKRPKADRPDRAGSIDAIYADAWTSPSDGHPLGMILSSSRQAGKEMSVDEGRRLYDPIETIEILRRPRILIKDGSVLSAP